VETDYLLAGRRPADPLPHPPRRPLRRTRQALAPPHAGALGAHGARGAREVPRRDARPLGPWPLGAAAAGTAAASHAACELDDLIETSRAACPAGPGSRHNFGADPNISAAYDYYDFFTNGRDLGRITDKGPLSNDRRHQLKLSGIYITPFKLSVGLAAYYRSGTPVTAYGYSDSYARYEFFLTTRGALGRTPSNYDADLHLGYPLPVGPVTLNFLFDVFNVFNTQRPVLLDERWGFQESDNASPTPVNPNFRNRCCARRRPRCGWGCG
jgi:hypothetical protein